MKYVEIYIASFILVLFSILFGCSKAEGRYEINPDYIKGEWGWKGEYLNRIKFLEGECYFPLSKRPIYYNYEVIQDTLIITDDRQGIITYLIKDINYEKMKLRLIDFKNGYGEIGKLLNNKKENTIYRLVPMDSIVTDHGHNIHKERLKRFFHLK